jgi:hypothetical protein
MDHLSFIGLRFFQSLMLRLARGFGANDRVFVSIEPLPANGADVLYPFAKGLECGTGVSHVHSAAFMDLSMAVLMIFTPA